MRVQHINEPAHTFRENYYYEKWLMCELNNGAHMFYRECAYY